MEYDLSRNSDGLQLIISTNYAASSCGIPVVILAGNLVDLQTDIGCGVCVADALIGRALEIADDYNYRHPAWVRLAVKKILAQWPEGPQMLDRHCANEIIFDLNS